MEALQLVEASATKPGDTLALGWFGSPPHDSGRYEIRARGADGRRWRAEGYSVERLVLVEVDE
jgi:hypothetical protein